MSGFYSALTPAQLLEMLATARSRMGALLEARATGIKRVTHGDKTTEFRSDGELAAALRALEAEIATLLALLAGQPVARKIQRAVYVVGSKGL